MTNFAPHIAIIGAGIGGLAAALRLAHNGARVSVFERHATPGGKMRTVPSIAGPIDAGPTVLTMKPVFDTLFSEVGLRLDEHVTMVPQQTLARHFWPDGTTLDLMQNHADNTENIRAAFGAKSAEEFTTFSERAAKLYAAFNPSMMQSPAPSRASLARFVAQNPSLIPAMDPLRSLAKSLFHQFCDPRLAQLFSRYATYVGGLPQLSPALLSLIWHAEAQGVWSVKGGMHQLARAITDCAASFGATFHYNSHVTQIETQGGAACAVHTTEQRHPVDAILFNGDPRALETGHLGADISSAVPKAAVDPRSLSASVLSFAATPQGVDLSAHNVFFANDPLTEYTALAKGQMQSDPTLYVCAQDRFNDATPQGPERFEIILNNPPTSPDQARQPCQTHILQRLAAHGLTFSQDQITETQPQDFAQMFPASNGSLYGRSPHGMMAAFKRPTARTRIKGLYLAGGGAHPGAGVPMAALSARHAAAAIMSDQTST